MTAPLRVGGRGRLPGGALVTWSVAEGARGRRWRAAVAAGDALRAVLLLEVGVDGGPDKLELATPAGLLTVHREPDGRLHGNVVSSSGVAPIVAPFGDRHALAVEALPIGVAVACHRLAASVGVGEGIDLPIVAIGLDLSVRSAVATVRRRAAGEWTVDGQPLAVDARGVIVLGNASEWPLEPDGGGLDSAR